MAPQPAVVNLARTVGVAISLVVLAAACGGNDGGAEADAAGPEPLTADQQNRLAGVLVDNLESGGAAFVASVRTPAGETMTLTGEVDWVDHVGRADVIATGPEADLVEVTWTIDAILERRPSLSAALLGEGGIVVDHIARSPAPATRSVDRVVALIAALAGERRDNPLLIGAAEGSAYLGTATVGGREAEVLRYGQENRYSLDVESGELVRFEQPPTADRDAIVIDFTDRGERSIALPAPEVVVTAASLGDRYPFPL